MSAERQVGRERQVVSRETGGGQQGDRWGSRRETGVGGGYLQSRSRFDLWPL